MVSELAFTFYVHVYGLSNLVGHFFKIISFYLVYKAIIETSLTQPYRLLFREIGQREEALAASEARYRSLFANMIDGFALHRVIKDKSGEPVDYVFLEANEAIEKITGLQRDEIAGRRVTEVLPGIENDPANWISTYGQVAITGREARFEQYAAPLDKWYAVAAYSPMTDHFVTICKDITERKQAEAKIAALNEELHLHVTQIEAAHQELETFSYSVSHDLRGPLRRINGFSQILLDEYLDKLDTEGKDYLERISAATLKMGQLIDELLQLARISRTAIKSEKTDLSAMSVTIADSLKSSQPERQVDVIVTNGLVVQGDRNLLGVALENLIGNAWKFTQKQPRALIEFGQTSLDDNRTAFFVKDNGAGLDMAYADKLFTPFQRLHHEDEFPGTGIGLATVQRIINHHGGQIWIEGQKGKGATVYFTLT
jgi:PAS domain S-box-containing protein